MNKVVPINRVRGTGANPDAQDNERTPEEAFLVAGAILTLVLPQFVLSVYGGLVAFAVCAGIALAGAAWGVASYKRSSYPVESRITGTTSQAPPKQIKPLPKAA
jgi:hypothetical protein